MLSRNPLNVEVLGQLNFDGLSDRIDELAKRIIADDEARSGWVSECKDVRELIDGKDERKAKPWVGASETSVPMLKRSLRRWKPTLFNLVWQAEPVCSFWAGNPKAMMAAPEYEQFFTWQVKFNMEGVARELQLMLENLGGDRGMGYLAVSWDYRSELVSRVVVSDKLFDPAKPPPEIGVIAQTIMTEYGLEQQDPADMQAAITVAQQIAQGAPFVRLEYRRVVADKPKIAAVDPFDVIMPIHGTDTHTAEYVCLRHRFTSEELKQMAIDGVLDPTKVGGVLADTAMDGAMPGTAGAGISGAGVAQYELNLEAKRGINSVSKEYHREVYQIFCRMDYNGDGIAERCVVWYDVNTKSTLAILPYVYPFDHWPVFRFDFDTLCRRPYMSRGIGHMFKDLQKHLNKLYRARSDAIDITLAPVFYQRVTSGSRARRIKWSPGMVIEVQQAGDFGEIQRNAWNLQQYLTAEGEIQGFVDQTLGNITADLAASGRRLERRSSTEASAVAAASAAMGMMEAVNFQECMKLVWQAVWDLWIEMGPAEEFFFVQGMPEPGVVRKSEIGFAYQLVPAGTPGNIDRQSQLEGGYRLLELAMKDPSGQFNLPVLYQYLASRFDTNLGKVALLKPEEQQQNQILKRAAGMLVEEQQAAAGQGGGSG
jgi:hypothetical protein